jgi:hypothetical protein
MGRTYNPEPFAFYNFSSNQVVKFKIGNNWQKTLANFERSVKDSFGNYKDVPVHYDQKND